MLGAMSDDLLDHPVISSRYFFPRPSAPPDPEWVTVDGARLACWHKPAAPGQRTFLHFHGNGEVVADYLPDYAEAVGALGVGVFLAEYRGYGGSTGAPQLGRMLEDAEAVFQHLDLPEEQVIVYGRSVGALFAAELAGRHPGLAADILESGVADVFQRLALRMRPEELGVSMARFCEEIDARLSHERKLGAWPGPLLVLHARDDDLVTPEHALANHRYGAGARKELVWFDHGGHNGLLAYNFPAYLDALERFFQSL
jgi:pimeloyl-ACP methyl ester carboxylesterase